MSCCNTYQFVHGQETQNGSRRKQKVPYYLNEECTNSYVGNQAGSSQPWRRFPLSKLVMGAK